MNVPYYYGEIEGDFVIQSSIIPDFKDIYDAGCLLMYDNDNKWIKAEFEKPTSDILRLL